MEEFVYCYERLYYVMKLRLESGKKTLAVQVLRDIKKYDKEIENKKDLFTEKQLILMKSIPNDYKEIIEQLEQFI